MQDDVPAIARLEGESFGSDAWSEALIRQEINAPARTYAVEIDSSGMLCGYAGYWYDGDDAELMTIAVSKAYQRRGIASALLGYLLSEARHQGARRMLLEVRVDNSPALDLYVGFGFERIGLRKRYYQPEGIDAYTMALDIDRWAALTTASQTDTGKRADNRTLAQKER
jgi:ribosomal-protein-alanine N-acetyltransferase